jgi:diguanylate cyclase (GGDEF)-like protein
MTAQPAISKSADRDTFGDIEIVETPAPNGDPAVLPYAAGPRLLLVEDEPVDRLQMRRLLQKTGMSTTLDEAESVATARQAIAGQDFDCVLLDYRLGDGEGTEVMDSIKAIDADRAPAVVFVTGQSNADLAYQLLKNGAVDVIAKDGLTPAALTRAVQVALSRRNAQPRSRGLLQLDPLTQLPGQQSFEEALDAAIKSSIRTMKPAMVFMVDIANLGAVTEALGRDAGDSLMKAVAGRLKSVLRNNDVAARIGVNRFAMIAQELPGASVAGTLASKTMAWLRQPYEFIGSLEADIRMGVSICPYDGHGTLAVMRATEAALATTLPGAAGSVRFYKAQLGRRMDRRRELTADLASAIQKAQLQPLFQPVLDCTTGQMEAVSAEIRWQHPVHGPVFADEFLPLAESAGLIGPIGEWTLVQCCDAISVWATLQSRRLCCSLPVSHAELSGGYLASLARGKMAAAGIDPSQITFRFDASVLAHNSTIVAHEIQQMSDAGFQLALEDYGDAGFHPVDFEKLPVQWLSLSPSIMRGLAPAAESDDVRQWPLRSITAMAKDFGIRVIVTGIASDAQLAQARACGASLVQGDFVAPPLALDDLAVWRRNVSRAGIWNRKGGQDGAA